MLAGRRRNFPGDFESSVIVVTLQKVFSTPQGELRAFFIYIHQTKSNKMKSKTQTVEVVDFSIREVVIPIVGVSPLIVHKWSEKIMRQMQDKQAGKAKNKKHDIRNPEDEYEQAKHISIAGWDGFPAAGFKAAMIRGAKSLGMVMKDTQTSFFVKADCEETQLIRIFGESRMRTDMVRVGMGSADIRYRPEYPDWYAELTIEFNEGGISIHQIHQLVKAAGYGCGVGEMRPEKGKFNYGRFKLANEK
jgi:hypothetical protein